MNQTIDLAKGRIGRLLFQLSMPAILAQLINVLYNIVDRMYIGRLPEVGAAALTGVGVCFPIITLISAFASLIGMGGGPRLSIALGEGNHEKAEKILGNALTALLFLSTVLTAFFLIFKHDLLLLFGASNDTIGYAESYLTIYLIGTVFVQLALGLNPFINAQGFAKIGMLTVVIGAALNIMLDPLFIFALGMGVRGAALATILSQAVSGVWVLAFLAGGRTQIKIRLRRMRPEWRILLPVLALGISPFVMQATESLVQITLNSGLSRYGGDVYVGAMTIINSITQILLMPLTGLGQGAQPIIGYNYGARQLDRVKQTFRLLFAASVSFSVLNWAVVMLFPTPFVLIFNDDPSLLDTTRHCIRIFLAGMFMMGMQFSCQQTLLALGQAKVSIFIALLRKIILLIPLALILPLWWGTTGIFLAEPIADATCATCAVIIFAVQFKRVLRRAEQEIPPGIVC